MKPLTVLLHTRHSRCTSAVRLLLCAFCVLFCLTAVSCTPASGPVHETGTDAPGTPSGVVTLPEIGTEADAAETEPVPTAADLDPAGGYGDLVITALYTPGAVVTDSLCSAPFIELHNNGVRDLSLAGAALYVCSGSGDYTAYPFSFGDSIPAGGHFLIRGAGIRTADEPVITLSAWDAEWDDLKLDPDRLRLVLAPIGWVGDPDMPLDLQTGLFTYASAHKLDDDDQFGSMKKAAADRLIRKKADTGFVDYQSLKLAECTTDVLLQIAPRTTQGPVNTTVRSRMAEVTFSAVGGVYEEGFDLTLSAPEGYTIYYTINQDDPRFGRTVLGAAPLVYNAPIHLHDTTSMAWGPLTKQAAKLMGSTYYPMASTFPGGACIRAYAVRESDGARTPLATETYFIGKEFKTWGMDLFSVSVLSDDFLGNKGIYLCNTSTHEHIAAYTEVVSGTGSRVFAGWTEIAMNGRGSLGMRQKSFRILFKSNPMDLSSEAIGENLSMLNYDVFGEYANVTRSGEPLTWFKHILLRNGGGDNSGCTISRSHIGDAYIQRINRYLLPDDMAYAPAMVFVNGEFFGLFNTRDRLDLKHFMTKYGVPEESLAVLECPYPIQNGQWVLGADYILGEGTQKDADDFNQLVEYVRTHNAAEDYVWKYVKDRLDVWGLADQFVGQMYLCCSDWPNNNVKIWRNNDPSVMDTKWHFTYVDTDHGVGLNSTYRDSLFGNINDGSKLGILINHLMQNKEFRDYFISRWIWCTEVYYEPTRCVAELHELVDRIKPVMQYQLDRWQVTNGEKTTWDKWWSYIVIIEDFMNNRQPYARQQIKSFAGINETVYQYYLKQGIGRWGDKVGE
ncbi:MAG: CotH kinase family protein [Clostridia bacterium]|nr:CotH kinase family protein [Clostridia bacterium]